MTETAQHSRRTAQLLNLLGDAGFTADDQLEFLPDGDGYVEHPDGIWIHASPHMVRMVVPSSGDLPHYRLVLSTSDLTSTEAIRIIAMHARAALQHREV